MRSLLALLDAWTWRMAWRDSRRDRRRLALFVSAMTIGVAALVAIGSFGDNLRSTVWTESRAILGADLRVRGSQPFSTETDGVLRELLLDDNLGVEARQVAFSSMALFPKGEQTRLVSVRALKGDFPFYGDLVTDPPTAARDFRSGRRALVDAALLAQFGVGVGDTVRIGAVDYRIAGALKKIPGESTTAALFGPRVYVPLDQLDPELTVRGSRVSYCRYYRLGEAVDTEQLREKLKEHAEQNHLRIDDVESTRRRLGRALDRLQGFLSLVGFVALILGGLGVGSAIHVHVRRKVGSIATLRCLGAPAYRTFAIYLAQTLVLGVLGALAGAALGLLVQQALPRVLGDFLPLDVPVLLSWRAVLTGLGIGVAVALAFGLLPLLPIRRVPPLSALRSDVEPPRGRDPLRLAAMLVIALGVLSFAYLNTHQLGAAAAYTGGLFAAFGLLALTARLLRFGARRLLSRRWPYEWRQGIANLYRPSNQTLLLMMCIGFGSFHIVTVFLCQDLLMNELSLGAAEDEPNLVLFDIQDDQLEGVTALVEEQGLPVIERVPVVTMRLKSVNGVAVERLREGREEGRGSWALTREYRSTYRAALTDTESLARGEWVGAADPETRPAPVSLDLGIAESLGVDLGDRLVWDVQGVGIETTVTSIRLVEWMQLRPNFFAVFPEGVLEAAPKFHVLVTRAASAEQIGRLQREVVKAFPNVSVVDVTLVLDVAEELVSRIEFAIHFMATFAILTGLLVLMSAVLTSRFQRLEESVLLRTLGATRRQVLKIMNAEYLLLGALATLTGLLLAVAGTWALARFSFEIEFTVTPLPLVLAFVAITGLTVVIGRLGSRGLHDRPPLEVLRTE